jgi:hypothetical protein
MIATLADANEVISGLMYFIDFHLLSLLRFSAEISINSRHLIAYLLEEKRVKLTIRAPNLGRPLVDRSDVCFVVAHRSVSFLRFDLC